MTRRSSVRSFNMMTLHGNACQRLSACKLLSLSCAHTIYKAINSSYNLRIYSQKTRFHIWLDADQRGTSQTRVSSSSVKHLSTHRDVLLRQRAGHKEKARGVEMWARSPPNKARKPSALKSITQSLVWGTPSFHNQCREWWEAAVFFITRAARAPLLYPERRRFKVCGECFQ